MAFHIKTLPLSKCWLCVYLTVLVFSCNVECGKWGFLKIFSRAKPKVPTFHVPIAPPRVPSIHMPSYSFPSGSLSSRYGLPSAHLPSYNFPSSGYYPNLNQQRFSSNGYLRPIGFENLNSLGFPNSGGRPLGPPRTPFKLYPEDSSIGRSYGWNTQGRTGLNLPSNSKPLGSASTGSGGIAGSSSGILPPYSLKPSGPLRPVGNLPPGAPRQVYPPPYTPHNPGVPPPAYNPAHNPAGYGPPPAYNPTYNRGSVYELPPAYSSRNGNGYPAGTSNTNQHQSGTARVNNVNINNINTNTNPFGTGYNYGGGGISYHYPSYHYSTSDVGSNSLGIYLGYALGKMTRFTYHSHEGFFNGYTPRYDHYEIHHYYHNRYSDSIPTQSTIQPNAIEGCSGDSGTICPNGTKSLCTNNGAILCVASVNSTMPCVDSKQGNCVKADIPCLGGTRHCKVDHIQTLSLPCISRAKVHGNITYVNNTVVIINNNTTVLNISSIDNNLKDVAKKELQQTPAEKIKKTPINTTPNINLDITRNTRETVAAVLDNDFCVVIVALPAEKNRTEQEMIVNKGFNLFAKYMVRAHGI